ncbi:tRNA (adenosine(37)-N6)-threonylcarbamoyltransferase complex ATPase subunit type 1 TsaE [uncultured Paludibaculum sp.]|uniref:tRNA (adenosine(37)-N6)-threonylcarbamoyltransferase complex ATPase subunit type 1 TsaE n=1 Tax=uncultured Paludibaculum sp. TaxID=1765020 RepID=UPI002AAA8B17|nr:tRNA (adenosine(37)-N6)-threonylcarbamoyltransferase complex ATPase subunit type 1 TsaE [uncultured Paludibaculum sp.]
MKITNYTTANEEDTIELGRLLAAGWTRPCVVLLIGNLGAGKTTLAKGIAEGLGSAKADDVSSPTFPLIHEYGEEGDLYHIDLYRLDTVAEVETLGLDEVFSRRAVVLLEWAERFPTLLPAERIEIRIEAREDETRELTVTELP